MVNSPATGLTKLAVNTLSVTGLGNTWMVFSSCSVVFKAGFSLVKLILLKVEAIGLFLPAFTSTVNTRVVTSLGSMFLAEAADLNWLKGIKYSCCPEPSLISVVYWFFHSLIPFCTMVTLRLYPPAAVNLRPAYPLRSASIPPAFSNLNKETKSELLAFTSTFLSTGNSLAEIVRLASLVTVKALTLVVFLL